jgi:mannose-1-phosphate guanylyltransferase
MTVDPNRNIADKVMVVGNRPLHLSRKVLETDTLYRYHRIDARNTAAAIAFAAFAAEPDDILIVTPSDHILMEAYETAIQEQLKSI